jgi:D-alanyl-D-alanine carboxypeptidase (penicillin-binding protein 5/6)
MRLIGVVLNTDSEEQRREDSETLLNYGFRNFEIKTLYEKDEVIARLPVKRGQKREACLVAGGPVQAVVPRGDSSYKITEELDLPDTVAAPVKEGDIVGTLRLKNPEGELIGEVELTAQESLKRLGFLPNLLRQTGDLIAGLWHRIWPL